MLENDFRAKTGLGKHRECRRTVLAAQKNVQVLGLTMDRGMPGQRITAANEYGNSRMLERLQNLAIKILALQIQVIPARNTFLHDFL